MLEYILTNSTRKSMLKSIFPLSLVTFLSRITGFIREFLLYSIFGAGPLLDVFVMAFRISQLTRRFFAEGSFSQALLPELANTQKSNKEAYRKLYHQAFLFLIICMGFFTLSVIIAPRFWISFLAPGMMEDTSKYNEFVVVLRWIVPYGFFISLVSFYALLMQLHHRYLLNGFSPIILNLTIIITLLKGSVTLIGLAQAVFFAGILQLFVQYCAGRHYAPFFKKDFALTKESKPLFVNFMKLSVMGFLILFNTTIDQIFLTYSHAGSISEYYLCERIIELPLGVIVYSLSVVFSSYYAKDYQSSIKRVQLENKAILFIFYFVLPCVVGGYVLAPYLINVFLKNPLSIERTAALLKVFVLCILPITLNKIFVIICTIRGQQNLIIKTHLIGSLVNLTSDYFFAPWSTIGIATSTMLTLFVQLTIFNSYCRLTKRFFKLPKSLFLRAWAALFIILAGGLTFDFLQQHMEIAGWTYFMLLISIVSLCGFLYLLAIYRDIKYIYQRVAY
ncbi:hypothetical protein EBR43_00275 [bacterium]|nr:hypothetical protein [bacterium]NBX71521.1 hypothetical protein [bacterium]